MLKKHHIAFIFTMVLFHKNMVFSQSSTYFGVLPQLNYYKSLDTKYALAFRVESRQQFLGREKNESMWVKERYAYQLTDFFVMGEYKFLSLDKITLGYMLRQQSNTFLHRTLQQYSLTKEYAKFRIGYRLRTDQTFNNTFQEARLRYRIAMEIPLVGQKLNQREFYLKFSHEQLHEINNSIYDLDLRWVFNLGYLDSFKNRTEFGYDLRLDKFLNGGYRLNNWITISYYFK